MRAARRAAIRLSPGERAVRAALRRRGLVWSGERDPTPLLLPAGRTRERHYALLGHYSYRLFLRDVLTLLNTDPDLSRNLGVCLAAHFRARGIARDERFRA